MVPQMSKKPSDDESSDSGGGCGDLGGAHGGGWARNEAVNTKVSLMRL